MRKLFLTILFLMITSQALAATYYLRTDGGTPAQCDGSHDHALTGATGDDCAWSRFLYATGWLDGDASRISPGDTVIVKDEEHRVGFESGVYAGCADSQPWSCSSSPIPSGVDEDNKTKIYGENYASCTSLASASQLFGVERAYKVLNLDGTDNFDIRCLDITDHEECGESHPNASLECERDTYPYGEWAPNGISWSESENGEFHDIWVHGLGSRGLYAAINQDFIVENFWVYGNPVAGWDGDLGDCDPGTPEDENCYSDAGTNYYYGLHVRYNGCVDQYPGLFSI